MWHHLLKLPGAEASQHFYCNLHLEEIETLGVFINNSCIGLSLKANRYI